jgi:translation initiation factor IF-3
LPEALATARAAGLDLVEVAPQAVPPVCKVMDWGKHLYDESMRLKESKRKQSQIVVKEMKFRPKIDSHDYETKKKHVVRFLDEASKVKITIMFRGREMTHTELGARILDRLAEDLAEIATVEAPPKLDGRNMIMVLAPIKTKEPGKGDGDDGDVDLGKDSHKDSHKGRHKGKGRTRRSADDVVVDEALPPAEVAEDVADDAAAAVAAEVDAEVDAETAEVDAETAEVEDETDDTDRSE